QAGPCDHRGLRRLETGPARALWRRRHLRPDLFGEVTHGACATFAEISHAGLWARHGYYAGDVVAGRYPAGRRAAGAWCQLRPRGRLGDDQYATGLGGALSVVPAG